MQQFQVLIKPQADGYSRGYSIKGIERGQKIQKTAEQKVSSQEEICRND